MFIPSKGKMLSSFVLFIYSIGTFLKVVLFKIKTMDHGEHIENTGAFIENTR